ncbi:MAG TPA: hypothetical protein H9875_08495 [Candidatus Levilactobacillus faecigallinarum]|uniref:Uncharacterized protein n=1 Tax=Candidatus Levilactobacillus faecigallinarum TaxID=2838638 RepID=A0A9D1QSS1_9LACO|nr:hypothetical protein [Candidatus Levilactobacillus faecigallinarum]
MRPSEVDVGQKMYLVYSGDTGYRTYEVVVTKVNTKSIYVRDSDERDSRFAKRGKFPIREDDPFGGFLGSTYLTDIPNQADLWEQHRKKSLKLDNRAHNIYKKLQSIDDFDRREQITSKIEEMFK